MSESECSSSKDLQLSLADTVTSPLFDGYQRPRVPLLYVTFRDQLLSPLVQGAMWGIVGLCLTQGKGALKAFLFAPRSQRRQGRSWWGNEGLRGLQQERGRR